MLQWMGGSRKRIKQTKKSLQNRQKKFFEQKRRQDIEATVTHKNYEGDGSGPQSLDLVGLAKLCSALGPLYAPKEPHDETKASSSDGIEGRAVPEEVHHVTEKIRRPYPVEETAPQKCTRKVRSPEPQITQKKPLQDPPEAPQKSYIMRSPSVKRGLTLLDIVDDLDTHEIIPKTTCSVEDYAAFALDGIGVAATRTPQNIGKKRCSFEAYAPYGTACEFETLVGLEDPEPEMKKRCISEAPRSYSPGQTQRSPISEHWKVGKNFGKKRMEWNDMLETRRGTPSRVHPISPSADRDKDLSCIPGYTRTDDDCLESARSKMEWEDDVLANRSFKESSTRASVASEILAWDDFETRGPEDSSLVLRSPGRAHMEHIKALTPDSPSVDERNAHAGSLQWEEDPLLTFGTREKTPECFSITPLNEEYPEPLGQRRNTDIQELEFDPIKRAPERSKSFSIRGLEESYPGPLVLRSPSRALIHIEALSLDTRSVDEARNAGSSQWEEDVCAIQHDYDPSDIQDLAIKRAPAMFSLKHLSRSSGDVESLRWNESSPIENFSARDPPDNVEHFSIPALDEGYGEPLFNNGIADEPERNFEKTPEAPKNSHWNKRFQDLETTREHRNKRFSIGELYPEPLAVRSKDAEVLFSPVNHRTDQPETSSGLMVYAVSVMAVEDNTINHPNECGLSLVPIDQDGDHEASSGHEHYKNKSLTTVCRANTAITSREDEHAQSRSSGASIGNANVGSSPRAYATTASAGDDQEDSFSENTIPAAEMNDASSGKATSGDLSPKDEENYVSMLESYILQLKCINKALGG